MSNNETKCIATNLRCFDIFCNASELEIKEISQGCVFKTFGPDQIVINEGDPVSNVYFTVNGYLQVYLTNQAGKQIVLKDLRAGDSFGELGVLCDTKRCASIITKSNTSLIAIDKNYYRNYYQNNLFAAQSVINILASSLSKITKDYESLALDNLEQRLIRILFEISEKGGQGLVVKCTHNEIANRVASTRESVSRAISALKHQQLIESKVDGIYLTNKLMELYSQI